MTFKRMASEKMREMAVATDTRVDGRTTREVGSKPHHSNQKSRLKPRAPRARVSRGSRSGAVRNAPAVTGKLVGFSAVFEIA